MNPILRLGSAVLVAVALGHNAAPADAATLTFDGACGASSCGSSSVISQSYGDIAGVLDVQYTRAYGSKLAGSAS